MSLKRKNIKPGQYWTVKYCNYSGPVKVVEMCPRYYGEDQSDVWSCIIPEHYDREYVNYLSGSRFDYPDFRKQITEKEFWEARIRYLKHQMQNAECCLLKTLMDK